MTLCILCPENKIMANNLSSDKKALVVSMLCEGSSIRAIERITGIHRDTIMRLAVTCRFTTPLGPSMGKSAPIEISLNFGIFIRFILHTL